MKLLPIILSLCCVSAAASAADLPENGYYRAYNHMSSRYVYVLDDKGKIDMGATSAELNAIELWKGYDKTISDPATVLNFKHISDKQYDVTSQGTGIHKIIDYYVSIRAVSSPADTYLLYATNSGMTKYLCDGERVLDHENGMLSDSGEGKWRYWTLERISSDSDRYFGVNPDIDCKDGLYASFFAEFPFSFASSGMKAVYVTDVDPVYGIAVVSETDGAVPGATPVVIRCGATSPSGNRLDIGTTSGAASFAGNLLKGAYFCNDRYRHVNRVANDKATMRVPGVLPDGSFGFVTSTDEYMPRNKAYLTVPAGTPETLRAMSAEEYSEFIKAGVTDITVDAANGSTAIYNMMGVKVGESREDASRLPAGLYIIGGRKVYINN